MGAKEAFEVVGLGTPFLFAATTYAFFYWLDRNHEVDFVVRTGRVITAIEVKSARRRGALPGIAAFDAAFRPKRKLLVGGDGIPIEEFLGKPVDHWLGR